MATIEITVFAKKRQTNQGKVFFTYLSTLHKADGSEVSCDVKFRDEAGLPKPENCPMNIIIEKADCNLVNRRYTVKTTDEFTGEVTEEERNRAVLWVAGWKQGGAYVDHSMDDFV